MKTVPPTTAEGIERYLGSGLVKGIGPILAKKLVGRFGAEVLAVIENRAAELQTVDGIGPKRRPPPLPPTAKLKLGVLFLTFGVATLFLQNRACYGNHSRATEPNLEQQTATQDSGNLILCC